MNKTLKDFEREVTRVKQSYMDDQIKYNGLSIQIQNKQIPKIIHIPLFISNKNIINRGFTLDTIIRLYVNIQR
jgi:hypothetical protein